MKTIFLLFGILFPIFFGSLACAAVSIFHEREVLLKLRQFENKELIVDGRCNKSDKYIVYVIDNFEQPVAITNGLTVSHGELIRTLLLTGRDDLEVLSLNTSLTKGLISVLTDLMDGGCADGVVSSIPGSNYTYSQISSFITGDVKIGAANILLYRKLLFDLLERIAVNGFPSVSWLQKLDANPIKLKEDAKKAVLIHYLGKYGIPVFLPYGNSDSQYHGESRRVNLLSLPGNARIYSGVDSKGNLLPGFPRSPLSTGDALAIYPITECPDYKDIRFYNVDVNNDGLKEFSYEKKDLIPFWNKKAELSFSPSLASDEDIRNLLEYVSKTGHLPDKQIVVKKTQYQYLREVCKSCNLEELPDGKPLVWLNSPQYGMIFSFTPQCNKQGVISGTSLIPPIKMKEFLPPKIASNNTR